MFVAKERIQYQRLVRLKIQWLVNIDNQVLHKRCQIRRSLSKAMIKLFRAESICMTDCPLHSICAVKNERVKDYMIKSIHFYFLSHGKWRETKEKRKRKRMKKWKWLKKIVLCANFNKLTCNIKGQTIVWPIFGSDVTYLARISSYCWKCIRSSFCFLLLFVVSNWTHDDDDNNNNKNNGVLTTRKTTIKKACNNNVMLNIWRFDSYFRLVNAPEIRWSIFYLFIVFFSTLMLANKSYIDLYSRFMGFLLLR